MTHNDQLLAFVDQVEGVWIRLGVAPVARRRLVLELEADLAAAQDAGAPVTDLVAADPVAFAVELAQGAEAPLLVPPPAPTRAAVIATALLGGLAGALFAWIFIETGPIGDLVVGQGPGLRDQYGWIPLQTLAALVTLAGIAGAVWWRFRATPGARSLALRTTALALVGGLVAFVPLIGYAWATDYDTSPYALVIGTLIGASILSAAIRLGTPRHPAGSRQG
jgi:hypothetical protein